MSIVLGICLHISRFPYLDLSVCRSPLRPKTFPTPHTTTRPHSRGQQVQLLFSSGLVTQDETVKKIDSTPHLQHRPPLGGDYLSITLLDGTRKYITKRSNHTVHTPNTTNQSQHLLTKSIQDIAAEAEAQKIARLAALREADKEGAPAGLSQTMTLVRMCRVQDYRGRGGEK